MKRYKGRTVICECDTGITELEKQGIMSNWPESRDITKPRYDYPSSGKYDERCPKCGYYPVVLIKPGDDFIA